jgi:transcriptional activator of cad operon
MELPKTRLQIGAWRVDPTAGEITKDGETVRLDVRAMRLLVCLAERGPDVVSIDELLKQVWPDVLVTADSVYQAVGSLRRVLGDDPKQPKYIATVPRLGYRMVAAVTPWIERPGQADARAEVPARRRVVWVVGTVLAFAVCAALILLVNGASANRLAGRNAPSERSIGVLPFLDLTEKMKEEEFADGLTEELINRLSRTAGFRVPPPTSSFHFKDKKLSVAEIARSLDVAYVLDGSTRRSGDKLRVAARLIRADKGATVWSETYDRPWGDILAVQDDIAGEVVKALKASLEPGVQ